MARTSRPFGSPPGVAEGSVFPTRRALAQAGVHRPGMAGISGTKDEGADSIVVSGGYEDDEDYGDVIIYTGAGGNDPGTKKQIADQTLDHTNNAGLVTSELEGRPVRVVRGSLGDRAYSPPSGFRYDGLFRVVSHSSKTGRSGFRIWQFRLEKIHDPATTGFVGSAPAGGTPPAGTTTPGRATGVVSRVIRNTQVTDWVKAHHDHQCQFCGAIVEMPGGRRYAEGAHIRALGRPHDGPDVAENVLCLCPTCHVRFDAGALYLRDDLRVIDSVLGSPIGRLRTKSGHTVDLSHAKSHRDRFGY